MRGLLLLALAVACTERSPAQPPADDASRGSGPKDALELGAQHLIVELRWIQVIDRHPEPGEGSEPARKIVETSSGFDETWALPADTEIERGQWRLAIPESTPTSFELTVDAKHDHRVILFSRGWKQEPDGRVAPAVILKSNWQLQLADGSGEGPNQVGFGVAPLGVWQATRAIGHHAVSFGYYELMEARFVEVSADPPADVVRGTPDTVSGQRDKEREWPTKAVSLP